jgi:uncharacterized protein (TIGR02266 family)
VARTLEMSTKRVLVAHRHAAVRDRFAVALADARHEYVIATTEDEVRAVAQERGAALSLALVDLALAEDGVALIQSLRAAATRTVPVLVFAGSVRSASEVPALDALGIRYINDHASTGQILPALAPHLFPDNFNRRSNARVPLRVPISFRAGSMIAGAVTLDVSKGGLGIRTMNPLPKDTAVHIKLRLPGTTSDFEASGRVSWTVRNTGMGVQFEQVSSNDQHALDKFVDSHTGGHRVS